jgi:hypothetical protein
MSVFRTVNPYQVAPAQYEIVIRSELDLPEFPSAKVAMELFDFAHMIGVAFTIGDRRAAFKTHFSEGWANRIVEQAKEWVSLK